mmetsp:Transcript_26321/g.84224  ORF Transcript_26321/g.84224 Transcript_26321/m.84224 type:complete len:213 (+) Transcript_26321:395-1033(+)
MVEGLGHTRKTSKSPTPGPTRTRRPSGWRVTLTSTLPTSSNGSGAPPLGSSTKRAISRAMWSPSILPLPSWSSFSAPSSRRETLERIMTPRSRRLSSFPSLTISMIRLMAPRSTMIIHWSGSWERLTQAVNACLATFTGSLKRRRSAGIKTLDFVQSLSIPSWVPVSPSTISAAIFLASARGSARNSMSSSSSSAILPGRLGCGVGSGSGSF